MKTSMKWNFFRKSALLVLFLLWAGIAHAAELVVYLDPKGSDQAEGLTSGTAVASLQTAVDKALQKADGNHDRLRIVVKPGQYVGQTAVTKGSAESKPLVIAPEKQGGERPLFDGKGKGTWLKLENDSGKPTRLTVEGLEISNYVTAVSLNGARTSQAASNSQNVIRNNIFRNIGQIANPKGEPSTAAVRLVNSDDNEISKNQFINIRNIQKCGGLHAIYIAHYSTGNKIEANVFDGGCGAAVKVRDASSNNKVVNNQFMNQEQSVFLDNFCDKNMRDDCTKDETECPSWNNEFKGNKISRLGKKAKASPVTTKGGDQTSGCPKQPPGAKRVHVTW